jgi:hypothetical protein
MGRPEGPCNDGGTQRDAVVMDERDDEPGQAPVDGPEPEPSEGEPAEHHPVTLDWVNQRRYDTPGPNNR